MYQYEITELEDGKAEISNENTTLARKRSSISYILKQAIRRNDNIRLMRKISDIRCIPK